MWWGTAINGGERGESLGLKVTGILMQLTEMGGSWGSTCTFEVVVGAGSDRRIVDLGQRWEGGDLLWGVGGLIIRDVSGGGLCDGLQEVLGLVVVEVGEGRGGGHGSNSGDYRVIKMMRVNRVGSRGVDNDRMGRWSGDTMVDGK